MVRPGSELASHQWLQQRRGLGELLDDDFEDLDLNRCYRIADRLLAHHATLEAFLFRQECDLLSLSETITLYDLTNTFSEGTARRNPKAKHGHFQRPRWQGAGHFRTLRHAPGGAAQRPRRRSALATPGQGL